MPYKFGLHDAEQLHAMYKEGSEACRNYSRLTMHTRTLGQQVFAVGAAGALSGIFFAPPARAPELAFYGGITLMGFAVALRFVDWHYQSAFTAIRNSLVLIEQKSWLFSNGPWSGHLTVRQEWHDHVASYVPFFALFILGDVVSLYGVTNAGWHLLWRIFFIVTLIVALGCALSYFSFVIDEAKTRDQKFARDLPFKRPAEKKATWWGSLKSAWRGLLMDMSKLLREYVESASW